MPSRLAHTTTRGRPSPGHRSRKRQRRATGPAVRLDDARNGESAESDDDDDGDGDGDGDDGERAVRHERSASRRRRQRVASGSGSAGSGGRPRLARRSSLPSRRSPGPHTALSPAKGAKPAHRAPAKTEHLAAPQRAIATRHQRVLSPLPTNHSVHRASAMPAKRTTKPLKALAPEPLARGQKRRRQVRIVVEPESDDESDRDEQDAQSDGEAASEAESAAASEEHGPRGGRHLRSADAVAAAESDGVESETQLEDEDEPESDDDDDAPESDVEMTDQDDHFHIHEAPAPVLRRLRRTELTRLFTLATDEPLSSAAHLTKEPLVQAVLDARQPATASDDEPEEAQAEETDDADSPHPSTSHEASPAAECPRKAVAAAATRRATRRHVPTPPPSSGSEHDSTGPDEVDDDARPLKSRTQSLPGNATRSDITRRPNGRSRSSAHLEPDAPAQRQLRTRRGIAANLEGRVVRLRNGKSVLPPASRKGRIKAADESESEPEESGSDGEHDDAGSSQTGPTPVAHRTRQGGSNAHSPTAATRPSRAAKVRAVARLAAKSAKGKEKAFDQDAASDDESDDDASDDAADDSDSHEPRNETDEEMAEASSHSTRRGARAAVRRTGRTRPKVQQVETPPSDADDESGGEEESADGDAGAIDEESEAEQVAARQLRNRTILLQAAQDAGTNDDDEATQSDAMSEDSQEDVDEDGEVEGGADVDLANATTKSLLRCRRDDLVRLCEERQLDGDGTKKELINQLLNWRESHDDSSGHSTASADSNVTARGETKTQALNAIASGSSSVATPLLMRRGHSSSPVKPHTPDASKADEHEEVNALDLESLQLQDKEIMPDKLTRLEKIGSGGFKDVYKGIYRKKTIAIADIRGHLTDMDIKELELLRDLRHPNIVHFIGVSIPKEPSSVPVMIVTELCANGDLFDYIRGVQQVPTFRVVLDIMLGIAKGVEYLHSRPKKIIHRDIKSSNVLITQQGVAKINDFGLARVKKSKQSVVRSLVGTVNWQAPELWVPHPRYNEKVDVYSVGLVFWEILQWHQPVKRYPFEGMNEHAIYDSVGQKNIRPSTASIGRTWGAEILNLINVMWQGDQSLRPDMTQVVCELGLIKAALAPEEKKGRR